MDDITPYTGPSTGTQGQGVTIQSSSSGLPPAPAGYRWDGGNPPKLVPQTNIVTGADGRQHEVNVAPPLLEGPAGSQYLPDGTLVNGTNGAGEQVGTAWGDKPDANPKGHVSNGRVDGLYSPNGQYTVANDHGTYDVYNQDGSLAREGASGAYGTPGFDKDHAGFAGVDDWVNAGLAPVTGGTSLINGSPTQLPGNAAQGAADAAMNGDSIIEGTWNGIKNDPSVQSVAGTVGKAAEGIGGAIGDLYNSLGGGGAAGAGGPAPPIDPNAFTVAGDPNYAQTVRDRAQALGVAEEENFRNLGNWASSYGTAKGDEIARIGTDATKYGVTQGQKLEDQGAYAQGYGIEQGDVLRGLGQDAANYGVSQGAGITGIGAGVQTQVNPIAERAAALGYDARDQLAGLEATQGPSAAEALLGIESEKNMANALALSRSGRVGYNPNLERAAIFANSATAAQTAQQYAALRAQEEAAWRQRQASNLATGFNLAQQGQVNAGNLITNAGTVAANAATAGAQVGQSGINSGINATAQGANVGQTGINTNINATAQGTQAGQTGYNTGVTASTQGANVGQTGIKTNLDATSKGADQRWNAETVSGQGAALGADAAQAAERERTARYGIAQGAATAEADRRDRFTTGVVSGLATAGTLLLSDIRAKKNVRELDGIADSYEALAAPPATGGVRRGGTVPPQGPAYDFRPAGAYAYEYRDPTRHGEGTYSGPMAHELRRTAAAPAVTRGPDGKDAIDPGRLSLTTASAVGEQQRRLDELENMVEALGGKDAVKRAGARRYAGTGGLL